MIGKTIGQYQVIDKIGEGGMGAVYKAEDTTLHRLVALKTLSGHLTEDEEAQERFVREAQSASSLNHPNITTVFEFIEDDDTRLICMEYVEGKTIRDMVESGIVSVRKAIDIITQAAEALEAAHNKGILHRDVKSANIMVNMEGRVKVMDFGLAQLAGKSQLTRTGTTLGTLSYSCPEQLTGRTVDRRSEVWSLGVVFYELLTGRIPFKGPSEGELVFAIINNMPEKVSKLRDDVPELVEAVVAKMLDKDPDLRYQNMGEVISDLSGIRKGLETSTVSLSEGLGQTKAVRRLGIVARIGIGVAVMAVLAVGAALLFLQRPGLDPNRVVMSLLENRTGDSQLDQFGDIVAHNIYSAIQPSQLIDLVPFNISAPFLERDEFLNSLHPNRTLAEFTGAGIVVAGAFYLVDDTTLECQVDIIDARNDRLLASIQPVRGPRENQTDLIKEVQQKVSTVLAMRLDPLLPDYVVSFPDNLDAYRAFLEGLKENNSTRWSAAVPHFMRALEADPNYSSAQINLAVACINFGDRTVLMFADSIVTVVETKRDQLPIIEATMTDWLRAMIDGNREAGYRAALEASEHTSVGSSGYFIGQEAMKTNRLKVAISAFEEVDLSIPYFQEWVPYWRRLIDSYNMAGKPKQALKAVYRGLEMHPENRVLRGRLVNTLSLLGRTAEVQQILEAEFPLPGGGDYWYGAARRLRAYSYLEEAQSIGERMISWFDNLSIEEQSGRAARVIVADGHYYADQLDDAERLYRSLNQETPANHNMILGVLAAMRGDREVARQWSNRIEENAKPAGKYNHGRAQFYQACIAAQVEDRDRAVELLREAYQRGRSYSGMYFWPQLEPLRGHPGYEEFMRPKG